MKPGDKVVCIKGSPSHSLYEGKEYVITFAHHCECGVITVCYGATVDADRTSCTCFSPIHGAPDEWACRSTRFAYSEDMEQAEYMVEELKEELEVTV